MQAREPPHAVDSLNSQKKFWLVSVIQIHSMYCRHRFVPATRADFSRADIVVKVPPAIKPENSSTLQLLMHLVVLLLLPHR